MTILGAIQISVYRLLAAVSYIEEVAGRWFSSAGFETLYGSYLLAKQVSLLLLEISGELHVELSPSSPVDFKHSCSLKNKFIAEGKNDGILCQYDFYLLVSKCISAFVSIHMDMNADLYTFVASLYSCVSHLRNVWFVNICQHRCCVLD